MKTRFLLAIVYGCAAFLLANWAIYLEILDEASQHPVSLAVYWLGFSALVFGVATLLRLAKPKFGLVAGMLACIMSLPLAGFAIFRSWATIIPRNAYETYVEGSIAIVMVATIWSVIALAAQSRNGAHLATI